MVAASHRKPAVIPNRSPAGKKLAPRIKRRARMLIDDVTAILFISPKAKTLCEFYRAALRLPLEEELNDGMPPHYGCSLGDVHFAIHPADGWPGVAVQNATSPVIAFSTSDLKGVTKRLCSQGVRVTGPTDHGFGHVISFRDPDGNHVSIIEYGPECW
jgi:predicted enzyme related to lactoylglutathione lyase